jgi:hypothetical protein
MERERERKWDSSERHYNVRMKKNISLVLKVPRQCSLVLLVGVMLMIRINFMALK